MNNLNPNFYMSVHTCSNMSNQRLSPGLLSFRRCKGRDKKKVYETSSYTSTGISNTLTVFLTLFRSYVFLGDGYQQHFHLFHQCVA